MVVLSPFLSKGSAPYVSCLQEGVDFWILIMLWLGEIHLYVIYASWNMGNLASLVRLACQNRTLTWKRRYAAGEKSNVEKKQGKGGRDSFNLTDTKCRTESVAPRNRSPSPRTNNPHCLHQSSLFLLNARSQRPHQLSPSLFLL
jgi:hypothetical protein